MRLIEWIDERLPLSETIKRHVTKYHAPPNLNLWWAFGAIALTFLMFQVVTGMWLTMFYKPDADLAFDSVERIMRELSYGWLIRYLHANGASFIFFAMYFHIGRGIYYGSYQKPREIIWWIGLSIFSVMMLQSFTGYVLPMGQMSYWAGTVITSLVSVIPFLGDTMITFIRGDFTIGDPALNRFFSLHVTILPLGVIGLLVFLHIVALHRVGSNNPEGVDIEKERKIFFYPYYVFKDLYLISLVFGIFLFIVFYHPDLLLEVENYRPANPLKTPLEISPEWYFLPFFTILRSIPDKLFGVIALGSSLVALFLLPFLDRSPVRSSRYRPIKRIMVSFLFSSFLVLGYVGMHTPSGLYLWLGRVAAIVYFGFFILLPFVSSLEKGKIPERLEISTNSLKSKRYGSLIVTLIILIYLNSMAFLSSWPDEEEIETGRTVFEEMGLDGHSVRYVDHKYYLIKSLSEEEKEEEEEIPGPDLSNIYKVSGEEEVRFLIRECMKSGGNCPDIEMEEALVELAGDVKGRKEEVIDALIAFLRFASDPLEEERKRLGRWVILYISILILMLHALYRKLKDHD